MNRLVHKLLRGFIVVERVKQVATLIALLIFFGYVGLNQLGRPDAKATPSIAPSSQK